MPAPVLPIALFAIVNLVAAPIAGRLGWSAMQALEASGARFGAVLLSVVLAAAILGVNVLFVRGAERAGLGRYGVMTLALIAGAQFAATIGTGTFSLVNLALGRVG
ncbi:MAG: hypothetical protein AAF677_03760 [Pseudomonadota bacterium]